MSKFLTRKIAKCKKIECKNCYYFEKECKHYGFCDREGKEKTDLAFVWSNDGCSYHYKNYWMV